MHIKSVLNRLGAVALALTDAQFSAARRATGLGPSAIAAVTMLGAWPGATIADLAAVAGVTHSVMVRTVEGLRTDGLVARQAVEDGRKVALILTDAGERLRTTILAARARALEPALHALPAQDRPAVAAALDAMLAALTEGRAQADHLCRLCDETACGDDCPVEARARAIERRDP